MERFQAYIDEYKKQLAKGVIQKAYKGLMEYMMELKTYLKNKYPAHLVSSTMYYGYMDMTYFSFTPASLKERNLKIAIVLIHAPCTFEVWLAGYNKQVQQKYWDLFKKSKWNTYPLVAVTQGADAIVEHTVADSPDFADLDALTKRIEKETVRFITDIESFIAKQVSRFGTDAATILA